nr:MAG TPA: hypothetical protein [Caudoviricetes sp.]
MSFIYSFLLKLHPPSKDLIPLKAAPLGEI